MNDATKTTRMPAGVQRLQHAFQRAREEGRAALIPYVTAGDPSLQFTEMLVPKLVAAGADIVEIGLPYSDPLADGPTIQRSGQRALAAGTTTRQVFDLISRWRARGVSVPVVLLAYYNCIFRRGEAAFVEAAAAAGVDGFITPDLPPEEATSLRKAADRAGVALIPLAAPTSTDARLKLIGAAARTFIYCVSVAGVTGARQQLAESVPRFLTRVRRLTDASIPLALGFGISDEEQARIAARSADGVIVGSALVERLEKASSPEEAIRDGTRFIAQLRAAVHNPSKAAGAP